MGEKITQSLRRRLDELTEWLHISPLGAVIFLMSAAALTYLHFGSVGTVEAPAVGHAVAAQHPSPVATVVAEDHVQPGAMVDRGAPLVTLSPRFLERELGLIDADIEKLMTRARLEQAELLLDEDERASSIEANMAKARRDHLRASALKARQSALASAAEEQLEQVQQQVDSGVAPIDDLLQARWNYESQRSGAQEAQVLTKAEQQLIHTLEQSLVKGSSVSHLAEPLKEAHKAELELLLVRRRAVLQDLKALTITARTSGRVVSVLPPGSAVARDTSVAEVLPDHATEVVAYVPSDQNANGITPGDEVRLSQVCRETSKIIRRGASVQQAPGQLSSLLGAPVYGTPIYLTLPENCSLGVGQVLTVELGLDGR